MNDLALQRNGDKKQGRDIAAPAEQAKAFAEMQESKGEDPTALRSFKEFADYVFKTKKETSYITKWKTPRQ